MVFEDLSQFQVEESEDELSPKKMASVHDRLMASIFDIVLFSPFISLLLFSLFKKIQLLAWVAPSSSEFGVFIIIACIFVFMLSSLFQALFLLLWGATPGMKIMKLRVVSSQGRITLSIALIRGFAWTCGLLALGIPFLEVLSHPDRRAFHDRIADTQLITLKKVSDRGPHPFEAHFIRKILIFTSLTIIMWAISIIGKFYYLADQGHFKEEELLESGYLCKDESLQTESGYSRIEKALALYWSGTLSSDCLWSEADFVLWKPNEEDKSWAYLAKAAIEEDSEKKDAYIEKVCAGDNAKVCQVAKAWRGKAAFAEGHLVDNVLKLNYKMSTQLPIQYSKDIKPLQDFDGFESFTTRARVQDLWQSGLKERAEGVFEGFGPLFSEQEKTSLLTYLCSKERDDACNSKKSLYCDILTRRYEEKLTSNYSKESLASIFRDGVCRKDMSVTTRFKRELENNPVLKKWVLAWTGSDGKTIESRINVLQNLANDPQVSHELKKQILFSWLDIAKNRDHLKDFQQNLSNFPDRGGRFESVYLKAIEVGLKMKEKAFVKAILSIEVPDSISPYTQVARAKAFYEIDDFDKVQGLLKDMSPGLRLPASKQGDTQLRSAEEQ